jgi:hypothetical protein
MSAWEEYAHRITGGASQREVGERIGHSHATARRWMSDGATPQQVIALALAYDADVLEALAAAGWLDPAEIENVNLSRTLRRMSSVALTKELYRRALVKEGRRHGDHFADAREPNEEVQ